MGAPRRSWRRRPALALSSFAALVVVVVLVALVANLSLLRSATVGADKVGKLDAANVGSLLSAPTLRPPSTATSTASVPVPGVGEVRHDDD